MKMGVHMSEKLEASVQRIREASAFIATKADDTAAEVKRIDRIVSGDLLGHGWQGRAATSYEKYWRDWKDSADNIVAALSDTATSIANAANEYEIQDSANAGNIGAARVNI